MNTQAHARGVRAGNAFRNLKRGLKALDQRFVSKAKAHKMPGWVGHAPLALSLVVIATTLIFGFMIFAIVALVTLAIVSWCSSGISYNADVPLCGESSDKENREGAWEHGHSGYGYYVGGIKMRGYDEDDYF